MENFKLQEQSDQIVALLEKADEQGNVTVDEILDAFPEVEEDLHQLEDLIACLYDQGIAIYESQEDAEGLDEQVEDDLASEAERAGTFDLSRVAADDMVSLYFREMSSMPLLTQEEEIELAKRMERGKDAQRQLAQNGHDAQEKVRLRGVIEQGESARDHLIWANTRLVVSVAKKYRGQGLPFLDLIQAGNLGLIKAADKFNYRRGNKFATYATWWIRQSVTRSLAMQGRTVRIPVHMGDRIRKLYGVAQRLEQDLGHRPTPEAIAEEMGIEPQRVRWMLRISRRPLSLERPVGEEEDSELGSFIEDEHAPSPTEIAERSLLREDLEQMLSTLAPREARVLRLRFGMQDGRTCTLEQVGNKLGVTRERARQIERKALRKLRHPRHSRMLRDYLR